MRFNHSKNDIHLHPLAGNPTISRNFIKMTLNFSENINLKSLFPQSEFEEKVISFVQEWFSESPTVKVQTSGSTGTPKIFDIEKSKMLHSAKTTCNFLGLKKENTALICLPIEYISGKMMVVRAIESGLKLVLKTPSSTPLTDLNEDIYFCAMSPLQVENSLDKIHFIKNLIIGGAAVSENLKTKITQNLKHSNTQTQIFETYGMSETLSHIALKEIYPKADDYFTTLDGIEISLDERGCLKINAPKLNDEILKTNDLVEIKHFDSPSTSSGQAGQCDKKQFKYLGRIDNVINSAGLKIYPEELENLVKKEIPNEVVFIGIPDDLFGQKLVAIIESEENEILKIKLLKIKYPSKNHQPKEIIFIKKIPRTENGKINRRELLNLLT